MKNYTQELRFGDDSSVFPRNRKISPSSADHRFEMVDKNVHEGTLNANNTGSALNSIRSRNESLNADANPALLSEENAIEKCE